MKNSEYNQENSVNVLKIFEKIKIILNIKTDNELATALGLSHRSRINYWKNNNILELERIIGLCKKFNISLNYLFLDKDNPEYQNNVVSESSVNNEVNSSKDEEISNLKSKIDILKEIILELKK